MPLEQRDIQPDPWSVWFTAYSCETIHHLLISKTQGLLCILVFPVSIQNIPEALVRAKPYETSIHLFRLRWQGCATKGLKLGISQTVLSQQNSDNRAKLIKTDSTQKKNKGILAYKGKSFFKSSSTPSNFMHNLGSFYIYPYRFVYNSQIKTLKYIVNNLQMMPWTIIFNLFRASRQS